jgi:hypothetical protein
MIDISKLKKHFVPPATREGSASSFAFFKAQVMAGKPVVIPLSAGMTERKVDGEMVACHVAFNEAASLRNWASNASKPNREAYLNALARGEEPEPTTKYKVESLITYRKGTEKVYFAPEDWLESEGFDDVGDVYTQAAEPVKDDNGKWTVEYSHKDGSKDTIPCDTFMVDGRLEFEALVLAKLASPSMATALAERKAETDDFTPLTDADGNYCVALIQEKPVTYTLPKED